MLLYESSSIATFEGVEDKPEEEKKSKLEQWQQLDAKRLKELYAAYRIGGGLKQEDFAEQFGLKSQGNMGHYLHGRRPLNLRAAIGFAKGLGVPIEKFSPTLAAEVEEAMPLARAGSQVIQGSWPFRTVPPSVYYEINPAIRENAEKGLALAAGLGETDASEVGLLQQRRAG